jgi:hypothetical protein
MKIVQLETGNSYLTKKGETKFFKKLCAVQIA